MKAATLGGRCDGRSNRQHRRIQPSQLFNDNYMPAPGEAVIVLHPRQEQVLSRCTIAIFSILDWQKAESRHAVDPKPFVRVSPSLKSSRQ